MDPDTSKVPNLTTVHYSLNGTCIFTPKNRLINETQHTQTSGNRFRDESISITENNKSSYIFPMSMIRVPSLSV